MSKPQIKITNLYKVFGREPMSVMPQVKQGLSKSDVLAKTGHTIGLKNINLEINKGEVFVIMGLSGCGKSTLIRHFNRLIDPTEGEIVVNGTDVMSFNANDLQEFRRHTMSMVFQRFGLMPHRTVLENVAYGLEVQGLKKADYLQQANDWLNKVGLEGYQNQYPAQLSGGQQQRVGLARALCTNAEILLMDEAFSALDPLIRSEMQDQLIQLQEDLHKTIVFITHDLDEALRIGDRIAILKDGELVQVGTPVDILLNPADAYVEAFVRDVNRARALTVETVMKPPVCRISAETISEALEQMKKSPDGYGYYVNDDGYQGLVVKETLEKAMQASNTDQFNDSMLETIPHIAPDALLEQVIPETLDTHYPLPVIDKDGDLTGELSRNSLARVLGENKRSEEENS